MHRDLIVARNLLAADYTAVNCNQWKRVNSHTWETLDGRLVRYCVSEQDIYGHRNCRLYLGSEWFVNEGAVQAVAQASRFQLEIVTLKWIPLKGEQEKKS